MSYSHVHLNHNLSNPLPHSYAFEGANSIMNLGYMMFTTERQRKDNMLDSNEVHVQIVCMCNKLTLVGGISVSAD